MDNHVLNPTIFVIFGGAGDLTHRKLIPALFTLFIERRMPEQFAILGLGRHAYSDEDYRNYLLDGVQQFSRTQKDSITRSWQDFSRHLFFLQGDFNQVGEYDRLNQKLSELKPQIQTRNRDYDEKSGSTSEQESASLPASVISEPVIIYYLATPPSLFGPIADKLGQKGFAADRQHARLVVEKPIGHDLPSTIELDSILRRNFDECQIFRIDHYLGKETVQNIMAFRFANPIFEPIWNRRYVDHVAITVAETEGVGHRAGYYEHAGALRDMVQNHLLQLLCLMAMEPPVTFAAEEIRNKKLDVLNAIRSIDPNDVGNCAVRGQYDNGWVKGECVPAYRQEEGVAANSYTETYAALKLHIDNWRWQDVPFYLRTGKRMPERISEISVRFRSVPHQSFPSKLILSQQPTRLILCIQPDEGIMLKFQAKQPGPDMLLRPVEMYFDYQDAFKAPSPEAYETLLWDVMINDATLFMRADQVEAAWKIVMPVLNTWSSAPAIDFPNYAAGTWGPETAEHIIARDGRTWYLPTSLLDRKIGPSCMLPVGKSGNQKPGISQDLAQAHASS